MIPRLGRALLSQDVIFDRLRVLGMQGFSQDAFAYHAPYSVTEFSIFSAVIKRFRIDDSSNAADSMIPNRHHRPFQASWDGSAAHN